MMSSGLSNPSHPPWIGGVSRIIENFSYGENPVADGFTPFSVVLIDQWGVIHNGVRLFPGVIATLQALNERGVAIVMVSNSSNTAEQSIQFCHHLGLPLELIHGCVTSGDVLRWWLGIDVVWSEAVALAPKSHAGVGGTGARNTDARNAGARNAGARNTGARAPDVGDIGVRATDMVSKDSGLIPLGKRCLVIGDDGDVINEHAQLSRIAPDVFIVTDAEYADFAVCSSSVRSSADPYTLYRSLFQRALDDKLPVLWPWHDSPPVLHNNAWYPGNLSLTYQQSGGIVLAPHKPYAPIYRIAQCVAGSYHEHKGKIDRSEMRHNQTCTGKNNPDGIEDSENTDHRALMIGDSLVNDIGGARALGLSTLWINADPDSGTIDQAQAILNPHYQSMTLQW